MHSRVGISPGIILRLLPIALFLIVFNAGFDAGPACADSLIIGDFSDLDPDQAQLGPWRELTFPRIPSHTRYTLMRMNGKTVVKAFSKAAASGLIRSVDIDANRYQWLSWSWRVHNILKKGDVTRKQGDDYPARIYVAFAFEPDKAGWWERTRHKAASLAAGRELPGSVLNYIWANHAPVGLFVDNPYTSMAKMIVVRSGTLDLNRWISERRNVLEDYKKAFGHPPPAIVGIAIMTDTDNTGEEATAYYGDIKMESGQSNP